MISVLSVATKLVGGPNKTRGWLFGLSRIVASPSGIFFGVTGGARSTEKLTGTPVGEEV